MATEDSPNLPKVSDSQRIGFLASKAFIANCPSSWICRSLSGDEDFGHDYDIQVCGNGVIRGIFRLQVKGTESPALRAKGRHFCIPLAVKTLNFYRSGTEPVLLVLCDLSNDALPIKDAPVYFQWMDEELVRIFERGIQEGQEEVTVYVPVENRLYEGVDVLPYLARCKEISDIGDQFDALISTTHPGIPQDQRSLFLSKIAKELTQKGPAFLEALAADSHSSWLNASPGTVQWFLEEATQSIRRGDSDSAAEALGRASSLLNSSNNYEQADYWNVHGLLRSFCLDDAGAAVSFEKACALTNDAPRHLVPWAESEMRVRHHPENKPDFSDVFSRLRSKDPSVLGMRSRLFAASEKFDEALEVADQAGGVHRAVARAIIFTMQSKADETASACDEGLSYDPILRSTKILFQILKARSVFLKAIGGPDVLNKFADTELPMTGPRGARAELLVEAWDSISIAVANLRSSGWPSNIEFIADIWGATAAMLGLQKEALPIISMAAESRPTLAVLQQTLESIAAQVGDFKLALKANVRLPSSPTTLLRRIALLNHSGFHRECIDLVIQHENELPPSHRLFGYAVGAAIESARKLVLFDLARRWEALLESIPEHAPSLALLHFFRRVNKNLLDRSDALRELQDRYQSLGRPLEIANQLFHEFDATQPEEALACIEISEELLADRMLDVQGALHLAQAFITCKEWNALLGLSIESTARFEFSDPLQAVGALALDKLGRTPEAHSRLKDLINSGKSSGIALQTYIAIASRSGFVAEAVECLEQILSTELDPIHQIDCLRFLFNLLRLTDPAEPRLVDIAWRIGELVQRSDESQEGIFLYCFTTATIPASIQVDEARVKEFQDRLTRFTQAFPESKILRVAQIQTDTSPEEMVKAIHKFVGFSPEMDFIRARIENQLNRGIIPFPFAWRPRQVLPHIPDTPTLWEYSKVSRREDRKYHLTMAIEEGEHLTGEQLRGFTPILDMVALSVISDLDLFDFVFKLFHKIAIPKTILLELQQMGASMSGSPARAKVLAIQDGLRARFHQILQPETDGDQSPATSTLEPNTQELFEITRDNGYVLYSDDHWIRGLGAQGERPIRSFCTLDVLSALEADGSLSPHEISNRLAALCEWNVGIVVTLQQQLASIPDALGSAQNTTEGVQILLRDKTFDAIFSRIWSIDKPLVDLVRHGGAVFHSLIQRPGNRIESVASMASLWLTRVSLHNEFRGNMKELLLHLILGVVRYPAQLNPSSIHRLWDVYHKCIEHIFGNRMEMTHYIESINMLGNMCGEIDSRQDPPRPVTTRETLVQGLTHGTSEFENFSRAYTMAAIRVGQEKKRSI